MFLFSRRLGGALTLSCHGNLNKPSGHEWRTHQGTIYMPGSYNGGAFRGPGGGESRVNPLSAPKAGANCGWRVILLSGESDLVPSRGMTWRISRVICGCQKALSCGHRLPQFPGLSRLLQGLSHGRAGNQRVTRVVQMSSAGPQCCILFFSLLTRFSSRPAGGKYKRGPQGLG